MDIPAVGSVHLFVSGKEFHRGREALPVRALFVASRVRLGSNLISFVDLLSLDQRNSATVSRTCFSSYSSWQKRGRVFFLFLLFFSRFLSVSRLISGVSASVWSRVLMSRRRSSSSSHGGITRFFSLSWCILSLGVAGGCS